MKNNIKKTNIQHIRVNKILKDPSNNIDISKIISKNFKNDKTEQQLKFIKLLSEKSKKNIFILHYFAIFCNWLSIIFLIIGIIIACSINKANSNLLYLFSTFIIVAFVIFAFKMTVMFVLWPMTDYWTFRDFLLDIKNNLSDDRNNFPLTIQIVYFKNMDPKILGLGSLKKVSYDNNVVSYFWMSFWHKARPFIEFSDFIIKYVNYCSMELK